MTDPAPTGGPSVPHQDAPRPGPLAPLGWAFYLASSWTWCIGMFLPVFLVRDYGLWGYVVFAVPNVVGAAAMGWVLRSRAQADRLAQTHAGAVALFSVVTIAFHAFWLAWLVTWIRAVVVLPQNAWYAIVAAALVLIFAIGAATRTAPARRVALAVWLVGAALLTALLARPDAISPSTSVFTPTTNPSVLFLAPVCIFGFALCPYLDATFLRARSATTPSGARVAFTLGFAVFFAAMILATLGYAGLFAGVFDRNDATPPKIDAWLGYLLVAHLLSQAIFTVEVHYERLATSPARWPQALTLPAVIVAALLGFFWQSLPPVGDMTTGEVLYRVFMSFYGLVFPAYVWVCMIPTRDGHAGLAGAAGKRKLAALAAAIIFAAPCYWVGFVMLDEVWLGAGLAVVLLSRLLVRGKLIAGAQG